MMFSGVNEKELYRHGTTHNVVMNVQFRKSVIYYTLIIFMRLILKVFF
jgi:hypothetical protein